MLCAFRAASRRAILAALLALACGSGTEKQLEEARTLRHARRPAEAIAILRQLIERAPDDLQVNYELGMALAESDQTNVAMVYLQKAEASPELGPVAGLALGQIYLTGQNFEEAIRAATRVLEREPDNAEALALRAIAAVHAGRLDETIRDADRALALNSEDHLMRVAKATALMRLGRLDEAEREFLSLRERAAESGEDTAAPGCASYADFLAEGRKDAARAEREYDRCVELYPGDEAVLALALPFYNEHGKGDKALALLRRAAEQNPKALPVAKQLAARVAAKGDVAEGDRILREHAERADTPAAFAALADFRRSHGDVEGAIQAIDRAIALTPKAADALLLVAVDLDVDAKRIDAARAAAARIELPVYRDFANARIRLAEGDAKGALAALETGLRSWPNNAGARFLAGTAALALGDRERALTEFVEATRSDRDATDAALAAAQLYLRRGEFDTAIEMATRHIETNRPGKVTAMLVAARAEEARGRRDAALSLARSAVREAPHDADALSVLAGLLRQGGDAAAVEREIAKSGVDLTDPVNERAIRTLASIRAERGNAAGALALADAGIAKHPDAPFFHELRGRILLLGGRLPEAKAELERALAIDAGYAPAEAALGSLLSRSGDAARGLELLDRAAERAPDEPDHAYQAALLVLSQGRTDEAITRLRAIVEKYPAHAGSRNELAWLLASRKQELPFALELAQRAARLTPRAEVLDTLGFVQLTSGDAAGAVGSLERSLALRPDAPGSRYRLGLALAATGRTAEAERAFRGALAGGAFPEAGDARARLAELERGRRAP
jgi:tetratricopeptide (TPR) repeat protein